MTKDLPLVIVGAGGHGRVVLDAAIASGVPVAGFIADPAPDLTNGADYLGGQDLLADLLESHSFIVAIGNQAARRSISERIRDGGGSLRTVIHPAAWISPSAAVGAGTAIIGGAIVNANARIGDFCILNTGSSVDHDAVLEDGVQICPGARLAGAVHCEGGAFVGTGAIIIPGVRIGAAAIIGAGAVVVRDIPPSVTAFGNPARAFP